MVLIVPASVISPIPAGPVGAPALACAWAQPSAGALWGLFYAMAAERTEIALRQRWQRQLEPGLN